MTLSELLEDNLVLPRTACTSKDELISKLVERIYNTRQDLPFHQEELLNVINKRELIGGTLLPSGLSVPHARLKDYDGFTVAIGIPGEPLLYEGNQIHMMTLMITSQSGGPYYLPVLAAFTKISKNREFFFRLCGAENFKDFINILREQDPVLN